MRYGTRDLHLHVGTAENVARIAIGHGEIAADRKRALVGVGFHEFDRVHGVGDRVERRGTLAGASLLLQELKVALLDVGRVWQHRRAEVSRGGRGVDRLVELTAGEERQAARVIDVGMTQHDRVELPRIEGLRRVEPRGVFAVALEEAAVEQHPAAIPLQQVTRPGDLAGGTPERDCDTHDTNPLMKISGSLAASARR
jgi:hypothetical protein